MAIAELLLWIERMSQPSFVWYVKRLSGNDTLANNAHQAGPYITKDFIFRAFPSINRKDIKNPDKYFNLSIDSHNDRREIRAIYYNNKFHDNPKKGRNEARFTNFGGISSPLLNPDNTGALTVFVFNIVPGVEPDECRVWVCRDPEEESIIEDQVGPVEPGRFLIWSTSHAEPATLFSQPASRTGCLLSASEIPASWLKKFPTGAEIIQKTVQLRPDRALNADERLIKRRLCEYDIFLSVEKAVEMPHIEKGFTNIDDFIVRAQTILQRRRSRSGLSLELHLREIFIEEGLEEDVDFSHQPESEPGKTPDFIFPSEKAYKTKGFDTSKLRMLAVKTTCKDRWRQILNEADLIPVKHLLTLQEGISESQFKEMSRAKVQLVVPASNIKCFPESIREKLQTLTSFIKEIKP